MKVTVRLYGTLSRSYPGYQHPQGIEVEISDGATVKDFLAVLEIPDSQRAVVIVEGRVLRAGDRLRRGAAVNVMQPIHGG
jgi:sulfur carrier protein ThiS